MQRQARPDTPGTLHHVMARGIEGANIFRTDKDRNDFLACLAEQSRDYGHTGATVARFLGVTISLVNRYAVSGDLLELRRDN